jgi:glycine C-acetyltransferase
MQSIRKIRPDPLAFLSDPEEVSPDVPSTGAAIGFWSKDYHGLSRHPAVIKAVVEAISTRGIGSGAARAEADGTSIFEELEERLAAFRQVEAVITFQTGFMTNLGVLTTVAGEADSVIYDQMSHPSVADGIRLSGAQGVAYAHRDLGALESALRQVRGKRAVAGRRRIVVATDAVFGMEGDVAPLGEIADLAERFGAVLVVDDAHGFGVLGRGGRGAVDHFGLHDRVDVEVATLSKAIGAVGGFAGGRAYLKQRLVSARPSLSSTALPPAVAVAAITALGILEDEPDRVERLWANAGYLRTRLRALGFDTGASETPIIPIRAGDAQTTSRLWAALRSVGVDTQRIINSRVSPRLRLIVTSEHTREDLDYCVQAMRDVGARIGLI